MLRTWGASRGVTLQPPIICTMHGWASGESEVGETSTPDRALAPAPGRAAATPTVPFSFPASRRERDGGRYQVPSQGSGTNRRREPGVLPDPLPPAPPPP